MRCINGGNPIGAEAEDLYVVGGLVLLAWWQAPGVKRGSQSVTARTPRQALCYAMQCLNPPNQIRSIEENGRVGLMLNWSVRRTIAASVESSPRTFVMYWKL